MQASRIRLRGSRSRATQPDLIDLTSSPGIVPVASRVTRASLQPSVTNTRTSNRVSASQVSAVSSGALRPKRTSTLSLSTQLGATSTNIDRTIERVVLRSSITSPLPSTSGDILSSRVTLRASRSKTTQPDLIDLTSPAILLSPRVTRASLHPSVTNSKTSTRVSASQIAAAQTGTVRPKRASTLSSSSLLTAKHKTVTQAIDRVVTRSVNSSPRAPSPRPFSVGISKRKPEITTSSLSLINAKRTKSNTTSARASPKKVIKELIHKAVQTSFEVFSEPEINNTSILSQYMCPVCNKMENQATLLGKCGHILCEKCAATVHSKCPICTAVVYKRNFQSVFL